MRREWADRGPACAFRRRCTVRGIVPSPHHSEDPLGRADWDDVDGDSLLYLETDHPIDDQVENLVGVVDVDGHREMNVPRLILAPR
jgi:hypothetical protein